MKKKIIVLFICISASFSINATAQVFPMQNEKAIQGIEAVDLHVFVGSWMNMGSYSKEDFQESTNFYANIMLNEYGIKTDRSAPHYLICFLNALRDESHVTYSIKSYLFQHSPSDVHILLWESHSFGYTGSVFFGGENISEQCFEKFVEEWIKFN